MKRSFDAFCETLGIKKWKMSSFETPAFGIGNETRFDPRGVDVGGAGDSKGNTNGIDHNENWPCSSSSSPVGNDPPDDDSPGSSTTLMDESNNRTPPEAEGSSRKLQVQNESTKIEPEEMEEAEASDDEEIDNDLFEGMDADDALIWEEEEKDHLVFEDDKPPKPLKKTEEQFLGFEKFSVLPHAPETHKYFGLKYTPRNEGEFLKAYQREVKILELSLPDGMLVKGYEDRMDLLSAIIVGPMNTPYEGGLFAFDIKLPNEYPHKPPLFYFISFTKERMNPNLYAHDGKVCVSLLGTWKGSHNCEKWSSESSLLQVLVSIQGLILVPEPYFNEPGYDRDPDNPRIVGESKKYNEAATVLMLSATKDMLEKPPIPWQFEVTYMFKAGIPRIIQRYEDWLKGNLPPPSPTEGDENASTVPDFPLLPFSGPRAKEVSHLLEQLKSHHKKYCSI